jgi:hypothetical protein
MANPYPALWIAGTTKWPRIAKALRIAKAQPAGKGIVAAVLFIARLHFR